MNAAWMTVDRGNIVELTLNCRSRGRNEKDGDLAFSLLCHLDPRHAVMAEGLHD